MKPDPIERYFDGEMLVGDDFTSSEITQWFEDEREAYAELGAKDRSSYRYQYHALNRYHAFRHLDANRRYKHACGFGSAYGDELLPLLERFDRVTIIDSSRQFDGRSLGVVEVRHLVAQASGIIDVPDNSFDLISCLGTLHHVPNVSFVVSELVRCLEPGGVLLVREPTTSMGDWRKRRPGLTRRERGIPTPILRDILTQRGLRIVHHSYCVFPPLAKLLGVLRVSAHAHLTSVIVDAVLCRITSWNYSYHRRTIGSRFAPSSDFYVCTK